MDLGCFSKNFEINHEITKYLNDSCPSDFDQHFPFKYFLKIAFEMRCHQNSGQAILGATIQGMNGLKSYFSVMWNNSGKDCSIVLFNLFLPGDLDKSLSRTRPLLK